MAIFEGKSWKEAYVLKYFYVITTSDMEISVKVEWPSAPLTLSLVHNALNAIDLQITDSPSKFFLQWSTYDSLDHERAHFNRSTVLSSSYTFRKSLIRKHFLSRAIYAYLKKNPDSLLSNAAPRTYEIELSFADELDEMWTDELWDLGAELDNHSWWILKPLDHSSFVSAEHSFSVNRGMADRGMGIRIFNCKEDLHHIFENFESQDADDENDSEQEDASGTAVITSQLRHFVIQVPHPTFISARIALKHTAGVYFEPSVARPI